MSEQGSHGAAGHGAGHTAGAGQAQPSPPSGVPAGEPQPIPTQRGSVRFRLATLAGGLIAFVVIVLLLLR